MKQTAFTIATEIHPDRLAPLKDYFKKRGKGVNSKLSSYDRLHFCCFVMVGDQPDSADSSDDISPVLIFEGNIDGSAEEFLQGMAQNDLEFLKGIYQHCIDYPDKPNEQTLTKYLLNRDQGFNAFYNGHPGRTLTEIRFENTLRLRIQQFLDQQEDSLKQESPAQIRQAIQSFVEADPELQKAKNVPDPPFEVKYGQLFLNSLGAVVIILLGALVLGAFGIIGSDSLQGVAKFFLAILIIATIAYLIWLRWAETTDKQIDLDWNKDHLNEVQGVEDVELQNHLSSVSEVKPGILRLLTLRVVLFVADLGARFGSTQGKLSGIVTIHFARWLVLKDPKKDLHRLVFFSNYDGSWENYLGEFIDLASDGLTAIWSNTGLGRDKWFPDTEWLFLRGGSRDEQRFKLIARNSQRTELLWYSAYPELSVKNVHNNKQIREQLFTETTDPDSWLRRF